jgi:hypothetical protein
MFRPCHGQGGAPGVRPAVTSFALYLRGGEGGPALSCLHLGPGRGQVQTGREEFVSLPPGPQSFDTSGASRARRSNAAAGVTSASDAPRGPDDMPPAPASSNKRGRNASAHLRRRRKPPEPRSKPQNHLSKPYFHKRYEDSTFLAKRYQGVIRGGKAVIVMPPGYAWTPGRQDPWPRTRARGRRHPDTR